MSANKKKTNSLADKIAGVLSANPTFDFDPEDDQVDATSARVLTNDGYDEDPNEDEHDLLLSKFRNQNLDLLDDEKYAGKKVTRKSLIGDDESDESDINQEDNDDDSDNVSEDSLAKYGQFGQASDLEDEAESGTEANSSESARKEEGDDEDDDDSDNSSVAEEEEEEEEQGISLGEVDAGEENFITMKGTSVSQQVKKGICVRNQMVKWESFLETRIQLQKCLIASNKMPQKEAFIKMKKTSVQFPQKLVETKNSISNVLDKMLELQHLLISQYPETKNLDKSKSNENEDEDDMDEEIPSDTDEENSEAENEKKLSSSPSKKRRLEDYENEISERHKRYKTYRNGVIQKWHDKTRIATLKTTGPSHTILNQIEYTLNDKERLIKRTQLKRSQYVILGTTTSYEVPEETGGDAERYKEQYNSNIYDDDDFYHQLLRELIAVKSADITDPAELSRQWEKLQSLKTKFKKQVDTKATKGRKIRYAVHSKCVDFFKPIEDPSFSEDKLAKLCSTLFKGTEHVSV